MTWARFAMITEGSFMRLTSAKQIDLMDEAYQITAIPITQNKNAAMRWAYVRKAQIAYREKKAAVGDPANAPPIITAAECNEWLRSLPPLPFHGE